MKVFLILKIPQNLLVIHKIQTYTAAALSERFERFLIAVFSMELIMVATVERILSSKTSLNANRMRAERLLGLKIEYIASDEFDLMYAAKMYPKCSRIDGGKSVKTNSMSRGSMDLTCLAPALNEPLLSFAEEQHEFRQMNFFKFAAAHLRETVDEHCPATETMDQVEKFLDQSRKVRDHIIRANLRLVISNAGKYATSQYGFDDLVSDGTLALMEAVDKFDYQRGFRFSTYATHAIRRSFFRKMERKQKDRKRFAVTDPETMASAPDNFEVDYDAPAEGLLMEHLVKTLAQHLTERELRIIEGRFGLNGRSEPQTLVQLSGELGICKERVRQVEGHALQKLHTLALNYGRSRMETPVPVTA